MKQTTTVEERVAQAHRLEPITVWIGLLVGLAGAIIAFLQWGQYEWFIAHTRALVAISFAHGAAAALMIIIALQWRQVHGKPD